MADGLYVGDLHYREIRSDHLLFNLVGEKNCNLERAMELLRNNITTYTKIVLIDPFDADLAEIARTPGKRKIKHGKVKKFFCRVKKYDEQLRKCHPNLNFNIKCLKNLPFSSV